MFVCVYGALTWDSSITTIPHTCHRIEDKSLDVRLNSSELWPQGILSSFGQTICPQWLTMFGQMTVPLLLSAAHPKLCVTCILSESFCRPVPILARILSWTYTLWSIHDNSIPHPVTSLSKIASVILFCWWWFRPNVAPMMKWLATVGDWHWTLDFMLSKKLSYLCYKSKNWIQWFIN